MKKSFLLILLFLGLFEIFPKLAISQTENMQLQQGMTFKNTVNYRFTKLDGTSITGVLLSQSSKRLCLANENLKRLTLLKADVVKTEILDTNSVWKRKILTYGHNYYFEGSKVKAIALCRKLSKSEEPEIHMQAMQLNEKMMNSRFILGLSTVSGIAAVAGLYGTISYGFSVFGEASEENKKNSENCFKLFEVASLISLPAVIIGIPLASSSKKELKKLVLHFNQTH